MSYNCGHKVLHPMMASIATLPLVVLPDFDGKILVNFLALMLLKTQENLPNFYIQNQAAHPWWGLR
jgi:hypothetical protein